jgi:hypothetical protein
MRLFVASRRDIKICGGRTVPSCDQETKLVDRIRKLSKSGFPIALTDVRRAVLRLKITPDINFPPNFTWLENTY